MDGDGKNIVRVKPTTTYPTPPLAPLRQQPTNQAYILPSLLVYRIYIHSHNLITHIHSQNLITYLKLIKISDLVLFEYQLKDVPDASDPVHEEEEHGKNLWSYVGG